MPHTTSPRPHRLTLIAISAPTLLLPTPSPANLTILSSSRSLTAEVRFPPAAPAASDSSPVRTTPGPFDYSTATLSASGGTPSFPLNASSSAALTSNLSPVTGFSASATTTSTSQGAIAVARGSAQLLYDVSFTVDVPTTFTITGSYAVSNDAFALASGSDFRVKFSLTDFASISKTNIDLRNVIGPEAINLAGAFQPGKTYTLSAEFYVDSLSSTFTLAPPTTATGTFNFNLSNLTPLPEPTTLSTLALLSLSLTRRHPRTSTHLDDPHHAG